MRKGGLERDRFRAMPDPLTSRCIGAPRRQEHDGTVVRKFRPTRNRMPDFMSKAFLAARLPLVNVGIER